MPSSYFPWARKLSQNFFSTLSLSFFRLSHMLGNLSHQHNHIENKSISCLRPSCLLFLSHSLPSSAISLSHFTRHFEALWPCFIFSHYYYCYCYGFYVHPRFFFRFFYWHVRKKSAWKATQLKSCELFSFYFTSSFAWCLLRLKELNLYVLMHEIFAVDFY